VDDERFAVVAEGDRVKVMARGPRGVRAEVAIAAPDILRLVDGTASMMSLLAKDRLQVWADAEALLDLSAAIRVFSLAATGSGLIQREFEDFRRWVLDRPSQDR
jgi:hypothetical protein